MKKRLLLFVVCSITYFGLNAQCNIPSPPGSSCATAPIICPLESYCSTSFGTTYPIDQPTTFCGSVQSNSWIGFIPATNTMTMNLSVNNCSGTTQGSGLQAMVFQGCGSPWTGASNCIYQVAVNETAELVMNNLIVGEVYYFMIDGFSGDICDYTINVTSGSTQGSGGNLIADAGPDMVLDCNNTEAILDGSNSTYTPGSTFRWINIAGLVLSTDITYTTTQGGTYFLEVTESGGMCNSLDEVVVEATGVFELNLVFDTYLPCTGTYEIVSYNIPTDPNFGYLWTTTDGNIVSGETTMAPTVDAVGTYVLTITDYFNGCTNSDEIIIFPFDDAITVDSEYELSCIPNATTYLDVVTLWAYSPHFTYSWTTTDGTIVSGENSKTPGVTSIGTYNLVFSDTLTGCTTTASTVVVNNNAGPVIQIDMIGGLNCISSSMTLDGSNSTSSNPIQYQWTNDNNFVLSNDPTLTVTIPGIYTLRVTEVVGNCYSEEDVEVVLDADLPVFILSSPTIELNCGNNFTTSVSVIPQGAGNYSYSWSGPGGFSSSNLSVVISGNVQGLFEVVVTDIDNGCTSTQFADVVNNGFGMIVSTTQASCDAQDGTASVSTTLTNFEFEWSTGETTASISGLAQGWYSVTLTDLDNNCSKHENFYIDEDISCKVVISGYVAIDLDTTCVYAPTMEGIELTMVKLEPLGIYTLTDANGYYEFVADDGTYTVEYIGSPEVNLLCPASGIYNVTLNTNGSSSDDNHFFVARKEFDLCISNFTGLARPGFDQFNCIQICNYSEDIQDAVATFVHDPVFANQSPWPTITPFNSNTIAPNYSYDAGNNTFTWNLTNLYPGECRKIMWWMPVPATTQLGYILESSAKVNPIINDSNPLNNCLEWEREVTGSYDPNIKENFAGETLTGGSIYENDTTMNYLIHFQNVGTDTAYTVVVRDTLDDAHLDVTTIRGFTSSHDMQVEFEGTNVLIFTFENIYLVDSMTNEVESQGWLGFNIDRLPGLPVGTDITNQAAIYFDFNEPVITNEVVNTVDVHFYKIGGEVRTEINGEIVDVNVLLNGAISSTSLTDTSGVFSFEELAPNESYELNFEKNTNPWNGVTTQDIVYIRKHILGLQSLDSPYKLLAADVNQSGTITALDMAIIRSLILLNILEFPNNTSWKIVEGSYVFPDPTQPWNNPAPESISITSLDADRYFNMIGIKIGDVNNSVSPWNLLTSETREKDGVLSLSVDNQGVRGGEDYVVAFRAKDFRDVVAYQFTLSFDKEKLNYIGFEKGILGEMSEQNIGVKFLDEGQLTVAWTTAEGKNINDNEPLFFMKFKAKKEGSLKEILQLNSNKTEALAYDNSESVFDVELEFEENEETSTLQVFPNPATENIYLNINLEKTISIQLDIYNAFGQLEKTVISNTIQPKGFFQQKIKVKDFVPGTYFIKLKVGEETVVRKFIVI